jgi:mono/diheme cytochrome c family protein
MPIRVLFPALLAAVVAVSVAGAARSPAPLAGVSRVTRGDTVLLYSAEQAERGKAAFARTCKECHELEEFTGNDFRGKWDTRSVWELYEQIRTTMPDGNPGTLPREEYADVLAHLLAGNGLPAGPAALVADSAALSAVRLPLPPKGL